MLPSANSSPASVPLLPVRVPLTRLRGSTLPTLSRWRSSSTKQRAEPSSWPTWSWSAPVSPQETLSEPPSAELIAAAETGDVEAMRQLANLYRPTEALGVQYGNLAQVVYWYRQAYHGPATPTPRSNSTSSRTHADMGDDAYLDEAIACLEDAIRQGHRSAIINGAFRATFIEQDYRGFFLYALFEETEPDFAEQRWSFADQLTQAEIEEAEQTLARVACGQSDQGLRRFFRSGRFAVSPAVIAHTPCERMAHPSP